MLGMVFTELIEMVEAKFSPEVADAMLGEAGLSHGGAYTAVGYYDDAEVLALVGALARQTGLPAETLVRAFGQHLLGRFTVLYPAMFAQRQGLFELLAAIDDHIHVQVRKLYPQASLPRFSVLSRDEQAMRLLYQSPRDLRALAVGLIEGAAAHFGDTVTVDGEPWQGPEGASGTVFTVRRAPRRH
ncbi:heme NO-binding domain-containing protein [Ideonella livida]|uniref:Heme NO-binding domain-containing protein n=1 Tax=Ideonella livida TaxID=2707176 RepID=A0A7C9PF64_9BURK|nr:heme NO-binding domain-containing protein [Ideonella livida]NDY90168.1 hypothetical protein [Ideonella livida]